jgi:hypothetical protein
MMPKSLVEGYSIRARFGQTRPVSGQVFRASPYPRLLGKEFYLDAGRSQDILDRVYERLDIVRGHRS